MSNVPYANAVGTITYASYITRPDLVYAVGEASQHSSNPRKIHWLAIKRIFCYLKGRANKGITYGPFINQINDPTTLVGYTHADWAGEIDGRKSTLGYTFILANGAISWSSKK